MKLAALFSGGKDSTFAVYDSIKKGHEVKCLVSLLPKNPESYMFHYPNTEFTKQQAEAMNIPIIIKETLGEKEKELEDMESALAEAKEKFNVDGVVAGAIASEYQRQRVNDIAKRLGLMVLTPQWNMDPEKYWNILLDSGFKVMIIGVASDGLSKEWLGRVIGEAELRKLRELSQKHRFHLAFEGGEAETFVLDCPLFKRRIEIKEAEIKWEGDSGFYFFKKIKLVDK
ncbi:MAG: diphthine--ammonia ligase [Nanoarchaeota archaeon]